ncbi:hypothetical protein FB481_10316 [Pseudomonas sp. AG1028]|uniref:hypothetical protein n=1 Tax=Pseudomonas sp. AG1028 TaxID=2572911 RepID=UPI0011AC2AD2|nr:hypothetical protein [Pseudomonas sp. AG1028]TWE07449.1 hypothetical protein FB481_10316 [Pseudomonas sp. AG1028]
MKKPRSNFLTVLYIFAIATAAIGGFCLIGLAFYLFFTGAIFIDGVASVSVLLIFATIAWKGRVTWAKPVAAALLIAITAYVAMLLDARGNPVYNKPLEWLFAPAGAHLQTREIVSHGGASTGVNYDFHFVDASGQRVGELSSWIVVPFRFFEYLLILSAFMWPLTWLRDRFGRSQWLPPPPR